MNPLSWKELGTLVKRVSKDLINGPTNRYVRSLIQNFNTIWYASRTKSIFIFFDLILMLLEFFVCFFKVP